MKKIFIKTLFVIAFAFLSITTKAQLSTGLGLRYGMDNGVSLDAIQYFLSRNQGAAHLMLSIPYGGFRGNALYEIHIRNHNERIEMTGVSFFFGAGGHAGRYDPNDYRKNSTDPIEKQNIFAVGIDGIGGVEWKIPYMPLQISVDFHPFLDLNYSKQPSKLELGITARYLL